MFRRDSLQIVPLTMVAARMFVGAMTASAKEGPSSVGGLGTSDHGVAALPRTRVVAVVCRPGALTTAVTIEDSLLGAKNV